MSESFAHPARDPRLQQVLDRSAADPAFRARLLEEPHAAIRETFGIEIPTSFRLKFVERGTDTDALIVLPNAARPATADQELDEEALEAVAGGWDGSTGTSTQWTNPGWSGGTGGTSGDPTWRTWGG